MDVSMQVAKKFSAMVLIVAAWCAGCAPGGGGNSNPYAGQLVFSGLRSALMSVSGISADEIYAVGGDLGEGDGPNFLAFNGTSWRRISTGIASGDLWWISVEPIDGSFYLAGEPGLVVRFDPEAVTFDRFETPGTETIFGVWGTASDNLWAVGGNLGFPETGGVLWHFDGVEWSRVALPELFPDGMPILYKVWGRSANDVYAVGVLCTVLKFDGSDWSVVPCDSQRSLFTVHGSDSLVAAAGGFVDALIAEEVDGEFVNRAPAMTPQMNGVFVPQNGTPVTVGNEASLAIRTENGWELQDTQLDTVRDFHAVWVDPDGGAWAVGGNLGSALDDGILAYFGTRTIPDTVE